MIHLMPKPFMGSYGRYFRLLFSDVISEFVDKGCQKNAAALTYVSLFALVPILTVIYAMLSLVPMADGLWEQFQTWIFQNLVPESGAAIAEYLDNFTHKARSLTLPGVGLLLITAYLMLKNIEATFNVIWSVPKGRSGVSNFLLYWAILSLGPILLGAGLVMSTYLVSMEFFVDEVRSLGVMKWFLHFFPWVLTSSAFTLLFVAVPNCRVPLKDAVIGGVLTALCFEVAKDLFGVVVSRTSYELIYGAFALFPLFLLWIYILWMIILAGAVLVKALGHRRALAHGFEGSDAVAAVRVMGVLYQQLPKGTSLSERHILELGVAPEQWQRIRIELLKQHLLAETPSGVVICRCLRTVTLSQFMHWLDSKALCPGDASRLSDEVWGPQFLRRLRACDQHFDATLNISLFDLFEGETTALNPSTASMANVDGR